MERGKERCTRSRIQNGLRWETEITGDHLMVVANTEDQRGVKQICSEKLV